MPGIVLTVGMRKELLEILGMARRSGRPLLELAARRLEDVIERRGPRWPLPVQLALWAPESMLASPPESSCDAGPSVGTDDRSAAALRDLSKPEPAAPSQKFPEKFPARGRVPSSPKAKGANP
jgi:hypothetical protein